MKSKKTPEYKWNLGLLYKNEKDPQIETDMTAMEQALAVFEKKYKGKDFAATPQKLARALQDLEKIEDSVDWKPWWYFALRMRMDSGDKVAEARSIQYEQRMVKASNRIKFFPLEIGRIPKADQKKFLGDPLLSAYRYRLERIFLSARHLLSEKEEQMASLLSQTSYSMWVDAEEKMSSKSMISWKGKDIPLSQAQGILAELPKEDRREMGKKLNEAYKNLSPMADAEINAVYTYKKIMDELRGYPKPYSATVQDYENDEKTVETLVHLVTENFSLSRRFYALHAQLLGEKKITHADRSAKIGTIRSSFSFPESVSLVTETFARIDPQFAGYLQSFLQNSQFDIYPRQGKSGGAFCWGNNLLPTFILLNHTDDLRSVETLAHEMGHAIHTEMSKAERPMYRNYTMSVAEVASTFFEQAVSDEVLQRLPEDERLILLHNKVMGNIQTIFRQVACFNFELELHQKIRAEGQVPADGMASLMQKHMSAYMGPAVEVTRDDGYFFVTWSHIRNFFYVYSYAYGQLISRALYENWKKDHVYIEKVKKFLSAGSSMSPRDIFKSAGIDTADPKFFESGLKSIERDIDELEKLAKKTGLIKSKNKK
jgi:oligoendopeptidase F